MYKQSRDGIRKKSSSLRENWAATEEDHASCGAELAKLVNALPEMDDSHLFRDYLDGDQ